MYLWKGMLRYNNCIVQQYTTTHIYLYSGEKCILEVRLIQKIVIEGFCNKVYFNCQCREIFYIFIALTFEYHVASVSRLWILFVNIFLCFYSRLCIPRNVWFKQIVGSNLSHFIHAWSKTKILFIDVTLKRNWTIEIYSFWWY